jgi:hypothetical protein
LPAHERKRFEQRFGATPEGVQRVGLAKAVLNEAFAKAAREPAPAERKSWWTSWLATPRLAFAPSAAAVAIIGSGYCLYQMYQLRSEVGDLDAQRRAAITASSQQSEESRKLSQELDRERNRRTELEKELAQRQPARSPFLAFLLAPGLSRDIAAAKRLVLAPGIDAVRLDLELKQGGFAAYKVELQNLDGDVLWSETAQGAAKRLQVMIPARILRSGDYMVEVKGTTAKGESEPAGDYYFTLVSPR